MAPWLCSMLGYTESENVSFEEITSDSTRVAFDDEASPPMPLKTKSLPVLLGTKSRPSQSLKTAAKIAVVHASGVRSDAVIGMAKAKEGDDQAATFSSGSSADADAYSEEELQMLAREKKRWLRRQRTLELARKQEELAELVGRTRQQMMTGPSGIGNLPANRYGNDTYLPPFHEDVHVPTLALINPFSGAMAGADVLSLARKTAYYQRRFFNIIDVVKGQHRGGLLDVFRLELLSAIDEAKARGTRARIVCAGGDGTASFALFVIFCALRSDDSRADEGLEDSGNGFIISDEALAEGFPAIAQMPLGSANDFARTLGWGHKYPGERARRGHLGSRSCANAAHCALSHWIQAVIEPETKLANFDVWGFMPPTGSSTCDFKLCELGGPRGRDPRVTVEGDRQLVMNMDPDRKAPVPLFVFLYFSAGFCAYMTARFQINRRTSPLRNKLEYARQAVGILREPVPPQLTPGLEGLQVACSDEVYFPPRSDDGTGGERYREVGFLNINWQAGMAHGSDRSSKAPPKFNDGRVDMFRMKMVSAVKSGGLTRKTDQKEGPIKLTASGGKGKGVFFQWDGEARFAFSPSGEPFDINIRKILTVPVVLGPEYNTKVVGEADNGRAVAFEFVGDSDTDRAQVRSRIRSCVTGDLDQELRATPEDLAAVGVPCAHREEEE